MDEKQCRKSPLPVSDYLCFLPLLGYDAPGDADSYLHRSARAGRFGTKGLAIVFVSSEADEEVLKQIQSRFEVAIPELPDSIDSSTYMS